MNEPLINYTDNLELLKEIQETAESHEGFIYALKWGDDYFKIGKSKTPYQRYISLKSTAKYGGIQTGGFYVSIPHSNYDENESKMHEMFDKRRLDKTELFEVWIEDIQLGASSLFYEHSKPDDETSLFLQSTMNRLAKKVGIPLPYPGVDDWAGFVRIDTLSDSEDNLPCQND